MAARKKKSGSTKSAARKVPKMRKSRVAPKKAAKAPKRKVAAKRAVRARSEPVKAKKRPAAAPKAAVARPAPAPVPAAVAELDNRIAIVRANLRELVEQAASSAGAASEELLSQRITEQEDRLRRLMQERDALAR